MAEKDVAFQWIDRQAWDNRKKSRARYRWKTKHAPTTIRRRQKQPSPECPICMETTSDFLPPEENKCTHHATICRKCHEKLSICPYCRQEWKRKSNSERLSADIQEGYRVIREFGDALHTLALIWGRVQNDFDTGLYERRRRIHLPRLEAELMEDIHYFIMRIQEVDREQQVQIISRGINRRTTTT